MEANFLQQLSFMLSRWAMIEKTVKNMSTIPPDKLIINFFVPGTLELFIEKLKEKQIGLLLDYTEYILPTFSPSRETGAGLYARYAHRVAWLALKRLIQALENIFLDDQGYNIHTYFAHLCIPSCSTYHYKDTLTIAADILQQIYLLALYTHLENMIVNKKESRASPNNGNDPDDDPLFYSSTPANNLLMYTCLLDSYPIIPDDLSGFLTPTKQICSTERIDVLSPGIDNRLYVDDITQLRTCVSCKVDNLSFGLTDTEEQARKMPCKCVLNYSNFDMAYVSRATTISRVILSNKKYLPLNIGCKCYDHRSLFKSKLSIFKEALDLAHIHA